MAKKRPFWQRFVRGAGLKILPFFGYLLVCLIYITSRKRFVGLDTIDPDKPVIVAFWHEHILMASFHWKRLRGTKRNPRVFAMVSDHRDGEYIARIVNFLGIGTVRGSSNKGGAKALIAALKELKNGADVAFTPDGPQGPRHSVADGIILAAQKSGAEILPMRYEASACWRLTSWDRFVIPKPFGTITFMAYGLIDVKGESADVARERIKAALERLEA
ncbi:MAG: lysophospholipid acyltransferase family protein [Helicobacteraceae bacterium]|nr:lysophospholipid acyltransferase family protein [Helicobacteraceae bacterium]